MRTVRQTPRAINRPMDVVGIERNMLAGILMISSVIYSEISHIIGAVLFFGGCYAAKQASRKDPDLLPIARQAWKLKPVYCPLKRDVK